MIMMRSLLWGLKLENVERTFGCNAKQTGTKYFGRDYFDEMRKEDFGQLSDMLKMRCPI